MDQAEIEKQLHLALVMHAKRELDQAELICRSILSLDENNLNALNLCGCIQREKRKFDEGILLLSRAVSLYPGNPDVIFNLANLFKDVERWNDAISCYEKSLHLRPDNPEALNNLGICLKEEKRFAHAEIVLKRALSINQGFVGAWLNLGIILKEQVKSVEAINCFRKAIELHPDFDEAHFNLGIVLREEGSVDESIQCYLKAIEINPNFAEAYFNLGTVLEEKDCTDQSIQSYRKAIAINSNFAEAYWNLGKLLSENGKLDLAANAFASHYRLKPIARSFSFASTVTLPSVSAELKINVPNGTDFIPSYVSEEVPFGMHLMYIHIPKAGGIRFSNPIFSCIHETFFQDKGARYLNIAASIFSKREVSIIASHRIDSASLLDGITASFSSCGISSLDFSFLTPHGVSSRQLSQAMINHFDVKPVRLAAWRDPEMRLKSALDYLYRISGGNFEILEEKISARDPLLDNAIYRGCFSDFSRDIFTNEIRQPYVDHLINLSDFSVMNKIMTCFLSRCRLPNIIVNKMVNKTSVDKRMNSNHSDSFMDQCLQAGFISRDSSYQIGQIVSDELPEEFNLHIDLSSASLHPLTFVVNAVTSVKTAAETWLVPTEFLASPQGQNFLHKTFSD